MAGDFALADPPREDGNTHSVMQLPPQTNTPSGPSRYHLTPTTDQRRPRRMSAKEKLHSSRWNKNKPRSVPTQAQGSYWDRMTVDYEQQEEDIIRPVSWHRSISDPRHSQPTPFDTRPATTTHRHCRQTHTETLGSYLRHGIRHLRILTGAMLRNVGKVTQNAGIRNGSCPGEGALGNVPDKSKGRVMAIGPRVGRIGTSK